MKPLAARLALPPARASLSAALDLLDCRSHQRVHGLADLLIGLCDALGFEILAHFAQHVVIARTAGVTDEEIVRVADGPGASGWDPFDALLLRAADELHDDACLTEATYRAVAERYDEQQMLDLVFTVGQYHLVSMALNTFRVERDDGVTGMPIPDR